jgi:hypothetical protein
LQYHVVAALTSYDELAGGEAGMDVDALDGDDRLQRR